MGVLSEEHKRELRDTMCGADANVADNSVITLYGGATDGAKTAAATFTYRYVSAAVGSPVRMYLDMRQHRWLLLRRLPPWRVP